MFENIKKFINSSIANPDTKADDSSVIQSTHKYLRVEELQDYADDFFKVARQQFRKGHKYSQKQSKLTTAHRETEGYNEKITQFVDGEPVWEVSTSRQMPIKVLSSKVLTKDEYATLANSLARFEANHQR